MNHNTLKAKLEKDFYAFVKTLPSRVGETPESAIWDFISRAIDEAVQATEERERSGGGGGSGSPDAAVCEYGTNQLTDAANKWFYMATTEMNAIIPVLVGEFKTLLQSKKRVTRDMESTTINRFIDELIKTL